MSLKICCISDTHGSHNEIVFDDKMLSCDILIHAGDWSFLGKPEEIFEFNRWVGTLPFKEVIVIAGNHEVFLEKMGKDIAKQYLFNAVYLENETFVYKGYKIFGTPISSRFYNWAFMKSEEEAFRILSRMPEDVDVVVSHGPCRGILDKVYRAGGIMENTGFQSLRDKVFQVKPKLFISGHIHNDSGIEEHERIKFINCALLDDVYSLTKIPVVVEI